MPELHNRRVRIRYEKQYWTAIFFYIFLNEYLRDKSLGK